MTTVGETRWLAFVSVGLVFVLGVGAVTLMRSNREPLYEGKAFSYWLDRVPATLVATNGNARTVIVFGLRADARLEDYRASTDKALKAVGLVGGRCLPMLLRRLQTKDSPFKEALVDRAVRWHLMRASWISRPEVVRGQALTAIIALQYSAKPIFPALNRLRNDSDPEIRAAAECAWDRINPDEFKRLESLRSKGR